MAFGWYVVRTETRAEYLATDQLSQDGFEVFLPRFKTNYPRPGHEDIPLFPGYLFLRCDPEEEWPSFRPGHRVLGLLSFAGEIPRLPDDVVTRLMNGLTSVDHDAVLWRRFNPGERVRVISRSLNGFAEVVEQSKSPEARVKVLLDFMGRSVPALVPWENLQSVEEAPKSNYKSPRRTRGGGRWVKGFGPGAAVSA